MKKSKKSIYKKIGKILLILLLLYILGTIIFISVFPRIYLSNKYDTKMSDYKVYDYCPGNFHYDIDYWAVVWHDSYLVYEAKDDGRIFNVKFMNFQYYDAYQMKEVSEWITEELQNNVDKNIDMVNIHDTAVYGIYNEEKDKYKNVVWTKDNVNEIIKAGRTSEIFIKTDDIQQYLLNDSAEVTYYNSGNTNSNFDEYISDIRNKFNDKYKSDYSTLYLHEPKFPTFSGYSFYGIDINKITYKQMKYMIVDEIY